MSCKNVSEDLLKIKDQFIQNALDAGFQQVGVTNLDLKNYRLYYEHWLKQHYHGEMDYMQRHFEKRLDPSLMVERAARVISLRMDYLTDTNERQIMPKLIAQSNKAYISRYALGRDYHKVIRKRLAKLANNLSELAESTLNQRPFVDSAPILERAFAEKAGLGWIGKNTMLINKNAGSYFFLGEIITSLALPIDEPEDQLHCGSCQACLDACPTQAFVAPHQLDARKCISYLTIELKGAIPKALRPLIGNRVYGCDDCQIACPFNKFTQQSNEMDFSPRHRLDDQTLLNLLTWDETTFLTKTQGSPIRRIGYQRWVRNIAVGVGNAAFNHAHILELQRKLQEDNLSEMAKEHIQWAIESQQNKS